MRPKIFICSRIGGKGETDYEKRADFLKNIKRAELYSRWAVLNGYDPESTGFYFCAFLDDFSPDERKLGQKLGRERLKKCDFILVIVDERPYSPGMMGDIEIARETNIKFIVKKHQEIIDWLLENDYKASKRMFPALFFEERQIDAIEKSDGVMNELYDCYD